MHFFKKGNDWVYIAQDEYEERKGELPDLSFAIKCPIEDIPKREWPDLDALAKEVFGGEESKSNVHEGYVCSTHEKHQIEGILYNSKCVINSEEVELSHNEKTILEDDRYTVNPHIFIRVAKPMKKDAKLPLFSLEKFYEQESRRGIDIEIQPKLDL